MLKLKEHGYVENIGLSNITLSQLNRAIEIGGKPSEGGIVSVQNEFSPRYRHGLDVLDKCQEIGIAFLPWSPLGGIGNHKKLESGHYGCFDNVAKKYGVSVFAVTIAWHLINFPVTIPIPGATRIKSLLDTLKGVDLELCSEDIEVINRSLPPLGPIDSELVDVKEL